VRIVDIRLLRSMRRRGVVDIVAVGRTAVETIVVQMIAWLILVFANGME